MHDWARRLLNPESIAIVGASSDPKKYASFPLRNLLAANFPGKIFPVTPRAEEIQGVRCYPAISEVPEVPDLAFLIVDASLVPQVMEECGHKGVKMAFIGASGFNEAGEAGRQRHASVSSTAKKYGIRICGPNTNGVYNALSGLPIGYDFSHSLKLVPGSVAIASHSGALLGSIAHRALGKGPGFSYLVAAGNEMDLDLCDYMEFFLEDEQTRIVALLMEGLEDGERFLELVRRAHKLQKPVVTLKVGRSERGKATTLAHTGRMAGVAEVYAAAFRQFGVISTDTVESFLGAIQLVGTQPLPTKGRLMVLSASGAGASLMADKAEEYGIELAEISEHTQARIPDRFTDILTNPFDTAGRAGAPGFLPTVCPAFANDPANDCLLLFLREVAPRHAFAVNFCEAVTKAGKAGAAILNLVGEETEAVFREHRVPVFEASTDACFKALRGFIEYGRFCADRRDTLEEKKTSRGLRPAARKILEAGKGSAMLPEPATRELLQAYGLEGPDGSVTSSYTEARETAEKLGYPVILKGVVSGVAHKNEVGLVSRRISGEAELRDGYGAIEQKARSLLKEGDPISIALERYVPHDHEIILGVKHDDTFGPVILLGLGGIFTELLRDYALRLAPVTTPMAEEMLSELRAFPLLQRAFSEKTLDRQSLIDTILKVSDLALELKDHITALDINPLTLLPEGRGAMVLDAKVHLRS